MRISLNTLRIPTVWQSSLFIGLMAPTLLTGLDHHLFGVALPAIRHRLCYRSRHGGLGLDGLHIALYGLDAALWFAG